MSTVSKISCRHNAGPMLCLERHCTNNPDNNPLSKAGNQALKTGKASFEDWNRFATHFDSIYQFEKSEVCAQNALRLLGSPSNDIGGVELAVARILKFRLKGKISSAISLQRMRAALEDAREHLDSTYKSMPEKVQQVSRSSFRNLLHSLEKAIQYTSYDNSQSRTRLIALFRSGRSKFRLPEVAIQLLLKKLETSPDDKYLLLTLAAAYNDMANWEEASRCCRKIKALGYKDRGVQQTHSKALMYSGHANEAWQLLRDLPQTKESRASILAQMVICLFMMEKDCNWDKGDLDYIKSLRSELAKELRAFERDVNNPHQVQNLTLSAFIENYQLGVAWNYLDELAKENWKGNISLWRERIQNAADNTGIDLAYEISINLPPISDAFPDQDDSAEIEHYSTDED